MIKAEGKVEAVVLAEVFTELRPGPELIRSFTLTSEYIFGVHVHSFRKFFSETIETQHLI